MSDPYMYMYCSVQQLLCILYVCAFSGLSPTSSIHNAFTILSSRTWVIHIYILQRAPESLCVMYVSAFIGLSLRSSIHNAFAILSPHVSDPLSSIALQHESLYGMHLQSRGFSPEHSTTTSYQFTKVYAWNHYVKWHSMLTLFFSPVFKNIIKCNKHTRFHCLVWVISVIHLAWHSHLQCMNALLHILPTARHPLNTRSGIKVCSPIWLRGSS